MPSKVQDEKSKLITKNTENSSPLKKNKIGTLSILCS